MKAKKVKFMNADLDVDLEGSEVEEMLELMSITSTQNSNDVESVENKEDKDAVEADLQRELKDTYAEIFEDELPDSFNEEVNSFGLSKTESVKAKEKTARELLDW